MQRICLGVFLISVGVAHAASAVGLYSESQNQTGHRSPLGPCVPLQEDALSVLRAIATVGIYSERGAILFDDISTALTEVLLATAAHQDMSSWQLCVDLLPTPPSALSRPTVAMFVPELRSDDMASRPSLTAIASQAAQRTVIENSELIITVNSLTDSEAEPDACSVPAGSCNLRSAVAYCETVLPSLTHRCLLSLPEYQTLLMNASLGSISIALNATGEMLIEGNGCTIVGVSVDDTTSRLLSINASSAFALSMRNVTVV